MELRHLEIFCKIYESGSFSKAADSLYLTQPTISSHIKNLEDFLQIKLFDRLGREIVPTKAGDLLYGYAREIVALKEQARQALEQFSGRLSGSLDIAGSTVPGEYLIPPVIAEFREKNNDVMINLHIGDSHEVVNMVAERKVEMGIIGAHTSHSNIESIEIAKDELILVAPASFEKPEISIEELSDLPIIMRERGSGTRAAFETALGNLAYSPKDLRVAAEMGSTEAAKQAVMAGIGLSCLSKMSVKNELKEGALKIIQVEGMPISRSLFIIAHQLRDKSPLCQTFLDFILSRKSI